MNSVLLTFAVCFLALVAIASLNLWRFNRGRRRAWAGAVENLKKKVEAADDELSQRQMPADKLAEATKYLVVARSELEYLENLVSQGETDTDRNYLLAFNIYGRTEHARIIAEQQPKKQP